MSVYSRPYLFVCTDILVGFGPYSGKGTHLLTYISTQLPIYRSTYQPTYLPISVCSSVGELFFCQSYYGHELIFQRWQSLKITDSCYTASRLVPFKSRDFQSNYFTLSHTKNHILTKLLGGARCYKAILITVGIMNGPYADLAV